MIEMLNFSLVITIFLLTFSLICAIMSIGISLYCIIELKSSQKSTHKIEYVPLSPDTIKDTQINEINDRAASMYEPDEFTPPNLDEVI